MTYLNAQELAQDLETRPNHHGICRDGGILCPTCIKEEWQIISESIENQPHDVQWEIVDLDILDGSSPSQPQSVKCDHCYALKTQTTDWEKY